MGSWKENAEEMATLWIKMQPGAPNSLRQVLLQEPRVGSSHPSQDRLLEAFAPQVTGIWKQG